MESSPMAWKWIVEKLLDLPSFNVTLVNEMISKQVPDFEQSPLLERAALRNLEDLVIAKEIDDRAVLLLKELAQRDLEAPGTSAGFSIRQLALKELILRVQTEVVLSVLRKDVDEGETPNWPCFEAALEKVFEDAEKDNRLLERKRELSALLKSKNRTKATVTAYFVKYSFNKLRNDLYQFIKEKKESFPTIFLDQLSRDFLDTNGRPFPVPNDVKPAAIRKPDDVGHNTAVDQIGGQHILTGTAVKKRLRRKPLPTHDGTTELEKAEEGSAGMKKPRMSVPMPIVKPLLRQGVPELAVPASRPQEIKHLSSSYRSDERLCDRRNVDPEVMRSCSPAADKSISMEGITFSRRKNKYVVVSDVDSDADTEVAKTLSGENEGSDRMKIDGDKHIIEESQSLSENGGSRIIVEAEASKKRKRLADGKEASTSSPKAEVSQEDSEKFEDSQNTYEVDYMEVGDDGNEDLCHLCEEDGKLLCCEGCPIAMHFKCMEILDIRPPERNFYCPVCVSLKAAQRAAEAEKAAVAAKEAAVAAKEAAVAAKEAAVVAREAAAAAKEKLKAFKRESRLNRRSCGVGATSQEKADRPSSRRSSEENDRSLKPKQPSDDDPTLSEKEEQPTILRIEYHKPERDSEHSLPEDKSQLHGAPSVEQEEGSRGTGEQTAPTSEMRIPDEENAEQARAGVPDPGNRAGCRGEVEDDNDGAEDRSEDRNRVGPSAFFSGRHKVPGVRRIRLPWTRQEEHVLKEGVKRYSNNGTWGFQWKRIREFGQGTFDPSRTEVDLKDKWRNMTRAVAT